MLKFVGVGFSSYLCRCNEDATAIAMGNLTRGICGEASRWCQALTRKSQATLRQCQTPAGGDAAEERLRLDGVAAGKPEAERGIFFSGDYWPRRSACAARGGRTGGPR